MSGDMAAQTLTLAGKRFVILPESEYRKLRAAPKRNGKSATPAKRPRKRRLTAQDRGDIAESMRRMSDPNEKSIPLAQLKARTRALTAWLIRSRSGTRRRGRYASSRSRPPRESSQRQRALQTIRVRRGR